MEACRVGWRKPLGQDMQRRRYWALGGGTGCWRVYVEEQEGALWGWYQGDLWHNYLPTLPILRLFSDIARTPCWQWLGVRISEIMVCATCKLQQRGLLCPADAAPSAASNAPSRWQACFVACGILLTVS